MTPLAQEIVKALSDLAQRFGFAALVSAYFMFRDYRMSVRFAEALDKIGQNLAVIKDRLEVDCDD